MKGLTDKQREVVQYINDNIRFVMPTYRDIAKHFGMTVKGAYDHVRAIEKKGHIDKKFTRTNLKKKHKEKIIEGV